MFESRRKANAEQKYALIAIVISGLLGILMVLFGMITSSPIPFMVALAFFVISGIAAVSVSGTWGIGAEGEETVEKYLGLLGDSYRVIHDVVLPDIRGNLDHVVLGANGVFAIETKNHNGFITCSGDSWEQRKVGQRGTPYYGKIGCPSRQVKRYAITLRNLIRDKLGINLYVNCAVVFTNKDAVLRIDNPTVAILRPENLCQFIKTNHSEVILRDEELLELEAIIQPYSRFH
jgi:hypothetical protein